MISILGLLSYTTILLYGAAFLFCISIGLFYLAELVEEYTVTTGKIIRFTLCTVIVLQLSFPLLDGLSIILVATGIIVHLSYFQLLATYPAFNFTSFNFLLNCTFFIVHHIVAFTSESLYTKDALFILTYFTFFVWLVPFMFLLSLSANDDTLPQTVDYVRYQETRPLLSGNDDLVSSFLRSKRRSLYSLLSHLRDQLPDFRSKKLY
ncbi:Uncharacterized protein ECG_05077 [Echinococcus granulosus]|nr:Uncharacterized protein ECG_05077 [Echinococcus granulosus]CDS24641.1 protein tex261 [Echinococcus granulosus]